MKITLSFGLPWLLIGIAAVLAIVPCVVPKEHGWLGDFWKMIAAFACWPSALVLVIWATFEAIR
jgi:hypothetical protein